MNFLEQHVLSNESLDKAPLRILSCLLGSFHLLPAAAGLGYLEHRALQVALGDD
jgi:hypothetical protein